ncbi:hypothetical protein UMM65_08265 [Aureibaculum sp. 2210JD6-5]|uniref:hypothetical protein n=1 Tax=Aureibaculum sp. 2210JD6-5 TaxID=3103957 RepID=UPI002AAC8305|nr:hypothetical protein [Aureibaculum sp. 2210JD6-5]MDY7395234.1 hypothetical protein [Aureibaculum sp. 2210JD6-5]
MKKLFLIVLFVSTTIYSQNVHESDSYENDNFTVKIRQVKGDLNKDGLKDSVEVNMDTISKTRPLRLQIFFAQSSGKPELVVSSTKIIEAQYPIRLEGKHSGNTIPDFYIEKGNLIMESYINDKSRHTFKFRNGNFELIHFSKINWDGKETTTQTKFNLLTGNYIEEYQMLGSDEIFEKNKKIITIKPLPKIQDFIPFQTEIY